MGTIGDHVSTLPPMLELSQSVPGVMRKALVTALLLAAVVGSGACKRSGGQEEIRTTLKTFFQQAASGDPKACDLASSRYGKEPGSCLRDSALAGSPAVTETVDAVNEIKVTGSKATARIVSQGTRLRGAVRVVKEGGRWKFDGVDPSAL